MYKNIYLILFQGIQYIFLLLYIFLSIVFYLIFETVGFCTIYPINQLK